jgi:hypothetical protein
MRSSFWGVWSTESTSHRTGPNRRLTCCPAYQGQEGLGGGFVFTADESDMHAIPAAIAGAAQLLSTSTAVIYETLVPNHKTSNRSRSELVLFAVRFGLKLQYWSSKFSSTVSTSYFYFSFALPRYEAKKAYVIELNPKVLFVLKYTC